MDVNTITPFIEAMMTVLPQLGVNDVKRGALALKDKLVSTNNVTTIIGISKHVRGNVAYSMSEETARKLASTMMMGMPVESFDEMAQSAISEMSNMVAAKATMLFEGQGKIIDISPPTMIIGDDVTVMVSQVRTIAIEVLTEVGMIEVNVGLEV